MRRAVRGQGVDDGAARGHRGERFRRQLDARIPPRDRDDLVGGQGAGTDGYR